MLGLVSIQTSTQTPLSQQEQKELIQHEQTIDRGIRALYEMGLALAAIREKKLYRELYPTFEEYCRTRWEISKSHANRYIDYSDVIRDLTPIGVKYLPETESQARPLTKLKSEKRGEAWKKVLEMAATPEQITAKLVTSVVNQILGKNRPERKVESLPKHQQQPKGTCTFCNTPSIEIYATEQNGIGICAKCAEKALKVLRPQRLYPYQLYAIIKNDPPHKQQFYDEQGNAIPYKVIGIGPGFSSKDEADVKVDAPQQNYRHQDLIFGYLNKDEQFINLTGNEKGQQTT